MSATPSLFSSATLSHSIQATQVELTDSSEYRETLKVRPIQAVPGIHAVSVTSVLNTSRNPDAHHTRYQVVVYTAGLQRLQEALGAYLQRVDAARQIDTQEERS